MRLRAVFPGTFYYQSMQNYKTSEDLITDLDYICTIPMPSDPSKPEWSYAPFAPMLDQLLQKTSEAGYANLRDDFARLFAYIPQRSCPYGTHESPNPTQPN